MILQSFPIQPCLLEQLPEHFQEIPDIPKHMWIRGILPDMSMKILCVIGSRRATHYGYEVTRQLISGLAGYPIIIVSGLALGIDGIALESALQHSIPCIAFPGSGLSESVLYPRMHVPLAKQILESGGALLSEFPEHTKAGQWTFPRRNRLMAGIAHAILVIEAENESGTRITARLGTEYNRDVLAVPGSIFSDTSIGTNQLIREGATPITSSHDILEVLGFQVTQQGPLSYEHLSESEQSVMKLLSAPVPRDELIRIMAMPPVQANTLLSAMEIKGLITESMGMIRRV